MKKNDNKGRKFLNCTECGKDFEWLDTLLALLRRNIELAASSSSSIATSSASSKKDKKVKITIEIDDDGLRKILLPLVSFVIMIKKMEVSHDAKYFCEFCGKYVVKRKVVGIWGCKEYNPTSDVIVRSTIRRLREQTEG
ncbi:hypothetical protein IFM89_001197 [Coptis chinensis]|uniref:Uncharacterized protein n=1 Tax=Coptis chinensis TaxID=261450 RepID=A0A835MDS0_9MAGN|nr:hypothetical protein IFM89_001197 [Coptis chinensis]